MMCSMLVLFFVMKDVIHDTYMIAFHFVAGDISISHAWMAAVVGWYAC